MDTVSNELCVVCLSLSLSCAHSHFYQGTPIFISRAVEQGKPVSLNMSLLYRVPRVPESPECHAKLHLDRIEDFPEQVEVLVDPFDPPKQNHPNRRISHKTTGGGTSSTTMLNLSFGSFFTGLWSHNLRDFQKKTSMRIPGQAW